MYSIYEELYDASRESDHIYVLWTNRSEETFCGEQNGVHVPQKQLALVQNQHPIIHMMTIPGIASKEQAVCTSLVLVHEIAHTMKMYEAYKISGHDMSDGTFCMMEKYDPSSANNFYENVKTNLQKPFCDSCNEAMSGYTSNILILGNQEE